MLTLYAAKNTIALASHIALEDSGLPYSVKWLTLADGDQQKAEYLALNPKGRVPSLLTNKGLLTETPAILEYISVTANTLMPADVFAQARMREMMAYCASTFHVNHAHRFRGARWSDDETTHASMQEKVPETMAESCAYVEGQLPDTGWLASDLSIADIHLYSICRWLAGDGVNIASYPKLAAHFAAMQARPSVQRVVAAHA